MRLGFGAEDYLGQTDLQVAAVGWLAQHALFHRIAARWPERVRTLDSERMLAAPLASLAQLDLLFGVEDTEGGRATVVTDVFGRHAKFGTAFTSTDRARAQRSAANAHSDEISQVARWIEVVADQAAISLSLPSPLIDH